MMSKSVLLKDVPDGWDKKPLPSCVDKSSIPRDIKILQSEYLKSGKYPIIDQGAEFVAGFTDDESKLYKGNLPVVVFGDHTRVLKYVDFQFSLGADGTKLLCPKSFLVPKYFYYYLLHVPLESKGYNRHYKYLKEKEIIFPKKSEQGKVAFVLSEIHRAIAQQEKIIAKTKELKRSLMHRLFTYGLRGEELKETEIGLMPKSWEVCPIIDIVEKTKQIDPRRKSNFNFKYIDVSGISNEYFRIIEHKIYTNSDAPSRARKLVQTDDVIFATVRPTLKRIAYIDETYDGEICSTAFCVLRSKKDISSSKYLYYYLQRDEFIEELAKLQRGASYPAITDGDVRRQNILLPKIEEQQEITNILSNIDKKLSQAEAQKQTLQSFFKSMLQLLMTGQVRVKDIDFGEDYE